MGGFMKKMGFNLEDDEQYARAFQKGVLLRRFDSAAQEFDKAAKKFTEKGNTLMATRAAANALLYRYLVTKDIQQVTPLLQTLLQKLQSLEQQGIQEIEEIGSQTNFISIKELSAELDCRMVEVDIIQAQNDQLRSRDLHKKAADKFQAIRNIQLKTYTIVPPGDEHTDKAITRYFFHSGMFSYYEALLKKNYNPSAAADDLAQANQSFRACNNQTWQQRVTPLLDNWRLMRTCWVCHREMQGNELHFSMSQADIAPYIQKQVEKSSQDSISEDGKRIVVCAPCGSMVMYKARHEADIVRKELNVKLDKAMDIIQSQHERINRLERMAHHH